jgi:hypothetical protein
MPLLHKLLIIFCKGKDKEFFKVPRPKPMLSPWAYSRRGASQIYFINEEFRSQEPGVRMINTTPYSLHPTPYFWQSSLLDATDVS